MQRVRFYAICLILLAVAGCAIFLVFREFHNHDDKTATPVTATNTAKTNRACQIFTAADARALLGSGVKAGQNPPQHSSVDLDVSTCTYSQPSGSANTVSDRKSASLLVRAPKTVKGSASNQNEFGSLRPTEVQPVDSYGDSAYWDPAHGQLNILKNGTWYILSFGVSTPAGRSLDQARQLADLLAPKLQ